MLHRTIAAIAICLFVMAPLAEARFYVPAGSGSTMIKGHKMARPPRRRRGTHMFLPYKEKSELRNEQRKRDLRDIGNAFFRYLIDHTYTLPDGITQTPTEICRTGATSCQGLVDLSMILSPAFPVMPRDPLDATGDGTRYMISKTNDFKDRVILLAPDAENGWYIRVVR